MKRAVQQITILAGVLLLICTVYRWRHNTYTISIPVPEGTETFRTEDMLFQPENSDIIAVGTPELKKDMVKISIKPLHQGDTVMHIHIRGEEQPDKHRFRVSPMMTVYDAMTGGFTGDRIILICITFFFLATAVIMYFAYRRTKGPAYYSYSTIYAAGITAFSFVTGAVLLYLTIHHFIDPDRFTMLDAYSAISSAGLMFMVITFPLLLIFAVSLAISNIALLRHERFRPQNVLGIGISLFMIVGESLSLWMLFSSVPVRTPLAFRIYETAQNVYATIFAYFECMLFGAIVCGIKAARHVPDMDADYILILGCGFRKDGSLPPLLRGRVDRAIELWKKQRETTGKTAILIPSGGQGPNEVMPEAEAMNRYLLSQNIPEECILLENRSRNTYQNMEFSKELIRQQRTGANPLPNALPTDTFPSQHDGTMTLRQDSSQFLHEGTKTFRQSCSQPDGQSARVIYVTTNYHVFRSGVWANLAGLPAEGAGSRTKWWFWPNAFIRECVGLFCNRIRQEIALLIVLGLFFGALSMTLGW